MEKFMQVLKLVYYCLWTFIGILVLAGAVYLTVFIAKGGPSQLASQSLNSAQQGLPTNDPAFVQIRTCIAGVVGDSRADILMNGATPTADEQTKIISACSGLIGGEPEAKPATTTAKTTPAKK